MNPARPWFAACLLLVGCSFGPNMASNQRCTTDDQCGDGMVCFAEGCGNPGQGLVIEIAGDPRLYQFAQDFVVADGGVSARMDFSLGTPLMVSGNFQIEQTAGVDPTRRDPYTGSVTLRASGESVAIPGIKRSYETVFDKPERGFYQMYSGAGRFTLLAQPTVETSIPPVQLTNVILSNDQRTAAVDFPFPSLGVVTLPGALVRKFVAGSAPLAIETAVTLQAFDPSTKQPLSQRTYVSSGTANSDGSFTLSMHPDVLKLTSVQLVATQTDSAATSPVPTKVFSVPLPFPAGVQLEMGEYGSLVPNLIGSVVASDGSPVSGASVIVEGNVVGGGAFSSAIATSDDSGSFTLQLLVPETSTSFTMTVLPPATSGAAVWQGPVTIEGLTTGSPQLKPALIQCTDRVLVTGQVTLPSGAPAPNVQVLAVEQSNGNRPLPLENGTTTTDVDGNYQLRLDPGDWRFDYIANNLPQASRLWTVRGVDANGLQSSTFALPAIALLAGRQVTGVVTADTATVPMLSVPHAALRFFRVATVGGKSTSILLGTTTADMRGAYSVMLPAR